MGREYPGESRLKERQEWADAAYRRQPLCMCCGKKFPWPGPQVHEMERKSQAVRRWAHACNYLLVCEPCHAGPLATMPHVEQLARKYLMDRERFDLETWLTLRVGQQPRAITMGDVMQAVGELGELRLIVQPARERFRWRM